MIYSGNLNNFSVTTVSVVAKTLIYYLWSTKNIHRKEHRPKQRLMKQLYPIYSSSF